MVNPQRMILISSMYRTKNINLNLMATECLPATYDLIEAASTTLFDTVTVINLTWTI